MARQLRANSYFLHDETTGENPIPAAPSIMLTVHEVGYV